MNCEISHGLYAAYRRFFRSDKNHAILGFVPLGRHKTHCGASPWGEGSRNVI